jgi:hypothetical protein
MNDSYDDAIGVLSNTRRYQNTVIRSQYFDASHSTFNNVEGIQNNIVNVNYVDTVVDDSTSHPLRVNHEFLTLSVVIQRTNMIRSFDGCLQRSHLQIIIKRSRCVTRTLATGLLKTNGSWNGRRIQVHCYGSTENVNPQ